eukprot:TRINITY_DN2351_c0_g1_i3.p2 TRINITY_DN2351_c0_g1~~TRINITY_DN2351_c0_g1_i3.p2  ORF type:complete len:110 (+),score=28.47 TRINITY_DN2351_c0_g1_i3:345-674(+)
MHFFIPMWCDTMICEATASTSAGSASDEVQRLADSIDAALRDESVSRKGLSVGSGTIFMEIVEAAQLLFDGIDDVHSLHSEENMELIVSRYIEHQDALLKLRPRVIRNL